MRSKTVFVWGTVVSAFMWLGLIAHMTNLDNCVQHKVVQELTYCTPPQTGICRTERFDPPKKEIFCAPPNFDVGSILLDSLLETAVIGLGLPSLVAGLFVGMWLLSRTARRRANSSRTLRQL